MRAVAHSPEFAKKVGISQSVGRKFEEHKAEGGSMRAAALKKVFAGKETPAEERKEKTAAKKAGMSYKAAEKKFEGEKYCGGGKAKGYAKGGTTALPINDDMGSDTTYDRKKAMERKMPPAPKPAKPAPKPDAPIPRGGMTRQGGKLRTSLLREMSPDELDMPVTRMRDMGRGLELEPDMGSAARTPYKKGGSVRGVGIAKRGFGCTGMK